LSELFAVDPLATGRGRHLAPAKLFDQNIPLEKTFLSPQETPICRHCAIGNTITDLESAARWADTVKRKRLEAQATLTAENAARKDSLEGLI
jgi:hypothetical protein